MPFAVSLAKTFESELTLVHVMQAQSEQPGPQTCDALGWEISTQEARNYLERAESQIVQDLGRTIDTRLEQGRPARRIVDLARELDADVTVLGSHGEGGLQDSNLGSTAQQILASSQNSLFIVHPSKSAGSRVTPKRILVPLDGSVRTESVLPAAARLASAHGAELLLVHVVQEPIPTALLSAIEDLELAQKLASRLDVGAEQYLKRLRQHLGHDVANVRTLVVRHVNTCQCLLDIADREQCDLIVLSAHGSACDAGRSFGSVAAHLLTHRNVPLLVLQDLLEREPRRTQEHEALLAPPPLRASYASEIV